MVNRMLTFICVAGIGASLIFSPAVLALDDGTGTVTGTGAGAGTGTGTGAGGGSSDSTLIKFLTSAIQTKNQADAEFVFMDPPGKSQTVKANGWLADFVTQTDSTPPVSISTEIRDKELADLNWGLYATPAPGEKVTGSPVTYFLNKHQTNFCSPSSGIEDGLESPACKENTVNMEHADLRVSSLLEPVAYTSLEKSVANQLIRTLTVPFPSDSLGEMVGNKLVSIKDKQAAAEIMGQHAMLNVARNSFNEMWGLRLAKDTSTIGISGVAVTSSKPILRSVLSVMENESSRRFKDSGGWYDLVEQSSGEALLREMVHIEAFKLWMDYHKFRQNERIEALLAVLVSNGIKQNLKTAEAMAQMPQ